MSVSAHVQSPLMNVPHGAASSRSVLWMVLALVVGGIFIYAGAMKVWDPLRFARDIQNFHVLPWSAGIRLAFYLPWLEIICGLALVIGLLRHGALAILSTLMLVFIVATISAHARGINLDCGCFGSVSKGLSFTSHMLIDLAILGGLAALWFLPPRVLHSGKM